MSSAIEHLGRLEEASRGAGALPLDQAAVEAWRGFAFAIQDTSIALPFSGRVELVPCGLLTQLPLVKPWVKGITNIRGELFTVIDFSMYLGLEPVKNLQKSNLLLLSDSELKSALLIDSKITMKSFETNLERRDVQMADSIISSYTNAVLVKEGVQWNVLDLGRLCNDSNFINIGVDL